MKTGYRWQQSLIGLLFLLLATVSGWASNTPKISLSCTPASVSEGNTGSTRTITCTVSIDVAPNTAGLGLTIQTTDGTATTANSDYNALSTNLNFAVGTTTLSQNFTVTINGDNTVEPDETFTVSVVNRNTNASQTYTLPLRQTITIVNDDTNLPDMVLSKTATGNVAVNGTITYSLTVANNGGGTASGVQIIDTLPAGVTYQGSSASGWSLSQSGQTLTFSYGGSGKMNAGTSQTITITAKAPAMTGTYTNTAVVSTTSTEASATNNTALASTVVTTAANNYSNTNPRNFTMVSGFPYNIKGNMQIIGNSVMWDATNGGQCAPNGTNNNSLTSKWTDLDSDSRTYNSTSADLTLPKGVDSSKIKYAGLYWQGRVSSTNLLSNGLTVLAKPGGYSDYQVITSMPSKSNWIVNNGYYEYQSVADVTSLMKSSIDQTSAAAIAATGYSGTLWIGNVFASQMTNGYGAWALVIVYQDNSDTLKNLTVYDGFINVINATKSVTLSGFLTPTSGTVNSKFLVFAGEGDITLTDSVSMTNNVGSDVSLGNNVFQSSETINGLNVTTRNPTCQNTIGVDIHTYDIGTNGATAHIIGPNQSSTTVKLVSTGDEYMPGVFAFSTDLYVPDVCYSEVFTKNGSALTGSLSIGDVLDTNVTFTNRGQETAKGVKIDHVYVDNAVIGYNSGSMAIKPIGGTVYTAQTDNIGDDTADYHSDSNMSSYYLGTGAMYGTGGMITYNQSTAIHYQTKVKKYAPSVSSNDYLISYRNDQLGVSFSGIPINQCTPSSTKISIVNPDIFNQCGYFTDAISTRQACAGNSGGSIVWSGSAQIQNNPDTSLATCSVSAPQWVLDSTQTCQTADCKADPGNSKSVSVNYDNPPKSAAASATPTMATTDVTVTATQTLPLSAYDAISFDWTAGSVATLSAANVQVNTVSMTYKETLLISGGGQIGIGSILNNGSGSNTVKTTGSQVTTLAVNSFNLVSGTIADLEANTSIDIGSFSVGRTDTTTNTVTNVIIAAPKVKINTLTIGNSGSNSANIVIKADELDIGTLDMGQGATVTILPYTTGGDVFMRSTTWTASSSSTLVLSGGQYYVTTFNIPGTSNSSSVRAYDANQVVDLFINGSFAPGNNPGINSSGNGGNYGTLPAINFRLFVNGDLTTGGGGTTFNALVYVEGNAYLGSPTYLKGALSVNNTVSLGQGTQIVYAAGSVGSDLGPCLVSPSVPGIFDAWEPVLPDANFTGTTAYTTLPPASALRKIFTKAASQNFSLVVGSITADQTDYKAYTDDNLTCRIVTAASQSACISSESALSGWQNVDLSGHSYKYGTMTVSIAAAGLPAWVQCAPKTKQNSVADRNCSTDAFVIRPAYYQFTFSSTSLKAGADLNMSIYGRAIGGTSIAGYATSAARLDINLSSNTVQCQVKDGNLTYSGAKLSSLTFDTTESNASYKGLHFNDVGSFMLTTADNTWTAATVGGIGIDRPGNNTTLWQCIHDSNTTNPLGDVYGRIGCDINTTYASLNVVPDHFSIFPKLKNGVKLTNGVYGFTYLATLPKVMGAEVDLNVTAKNKADWPTYNYTSTCYAKATDYNLTYLIPMISPAGNLSSLSYIETNTSVAGQVSSTATFFSLNNIPKTLFAISPHINKYATDIQHWFDTNGTAKLTVKLNFDRRVTQPVEPFDFKLSTLSIQDTDHVSGVKTYQDTNATFVYGRIDPMDVTVYGMSPIATRSYIEVFGTNAVTLWGTALAKSPVSSTWWINSLHNGKDAGDANVTVVDPGIAGGTYPVGNTPTAGIVSYILPAQTPPYRGTAHIQTVDWLWYDPSALAYLDPNIATNVNCLTHPCFNIDVRPAMTNWVGSGTNKGNKAQQGGAAQTLGTDMIVPRVRE